MRVFLHLILQANYKATEWRGETILRGQLLTGRKQLSKELKLSEKQIRVALNHLKTTSEVAIKTTNRYSIITICNYNDYQDRKERKGPAERPREGPTKGQQGATSNKVNKGNNKKKTNTTLSGSIESGVFG